jgi:hypothetical protein
MGDVSVIWDLEDDQDGNVQHIAANDLTVEEAEEVLLDPDNEVHLSRTTGRPITFGGTSTGRHIAVIWETVVDDPRPLRVRTAYEVSPKRRRS